MKTPLQESWESFLASDPAQRDALPFIEQLHIAHVTGFMGGMVLGGIDEVTARALGNFEIERVDREGHPT